MNMERTRTNLHLKESKELEEMLKQDPKIENSYLKRVITAKDIQIYDLQKQIEAKEKRIRELVEIAVMYYEEGLPMYRVERILALLKLKEGLI